MKVLVVGGGGREHTLVWKISKSPKVAKIYCAPGNGGIADLAECVDIQATDIERMVDFAVTKDIDLAVIAPDDPLALGMVDAFEKRGIRAFGPNKRAAMIEGSKVFSKKFMEKHGIPTAEFEIFEDRDNAIEYLSSCSYPAVIKADGLALGKGVIIAKNFEEAKDAVNSLMVSREFGDAGDRIVIEEFMRGPEITVLCFTDGEHIVPMPSAQDHKKIYEGDKGPNTGGMGAFSPSKHYSDEIEDHCMEHIFKPTVEAMRKEDRKFKGVLYFGLMLTDDGVKVLEYNARFGDPETQIILPLLKTDIIDIFDAIIDEKLDEIDVIWKENMSAITVVLASGGYPGDFEKGYEIEGLSNPGEDTDLLIFHAGTKKSGDRYYTDGGRVLGVTAIGENLEKASRSVYGAIEGIRFKDMYYRRDIGK